LLRTIQLGMTEEEVTAQLGKPQKQELRGETKFLFYATPWQVAEKAKTRSPIAIKDGNVVGMAPAGEQFVPVVFTHQDKGTGQRAFVELRQQYPKLLQHRQSELQPVDVAKKGVWYRLVVLPPTPVSKLLRHALAWLLPDTSAAG
jgi:hypothetical protein